MIEFAIALPVVLVLLGGVIEFGTAFWRKQILTAAVSQGARVGTKSDCGGIEGAVKDYLEDAGLDRTKVGVTSSGCVPTAEGAEPAELTVSATYPSSFSILSAFGAVAAQSDGTILVDATVVMQME